MKCVLEDDMRILVSPAKDHASMWCSQCQQDVPALARSSAGPLVCPRCSEELTARPEYVGSDADNGSPSGTKILPEANWQFSVDELEQEQSLRRIQQIGRQLRTTFADVRRWEPSPALTSLFTAPALPPQQDVRLRKIAHDDEQAASASQQKPNWVLSILLTGGIVGLGAGMFLLAWAAAFALGRLWQGAMAITIGAEGLLILALTWMAIRLWQNGRRINGNLRDLDHQLEEIHTLAGTLSAERLSASQHYYRQYNQVASPHFLVANLRGQVDQLTERLAG